MPLIIATAMATVSRFWYEGSCVTPSRPKKDYTQLIELLRAQETFPTQYLHKFIGKNSPAFIRGVEGLEKRFGNIRQQSARMSKGDAHVAMTYVIDAADVDEIIVVLTATDELEDLLVVL
jgi:hypothetical protein